MKTSLAILCLLLMCSCSYKAPPACSCNHPVDTEVNRYQLHSDSTHTYVIDAQTGQLWGKRHSGEGNVYVGDGKSFPLNKNTP
jgi:hypothetical protein